MDGQFYPYLIEDGINWELGTGVYSSGVITRPGPSVDPTFESSSGTLLNLTGSATIACVANKDDLLGASWPPGPPWTTLTFNPTPTTAHGFSVYQSYESFSLSAGDTIEMRSWGYSTATGDTDQFFLSNMTNGYSVAIQGDNNDVFYRWTGSSSTAFDASGNSTANDYIGWYEGYIRVSHMSSSFDSLFGGINKARFPYQQNGYNTAWDFSASPIYGLFSEFDFDSMVMQARVIPTIT